MSTSTLARSALAYARRFGWPVLPVRPHAKEPLTTHGVYDATTDIATIHRWWSRWPDANIGLAAGVEWIALDIDPRAEGDDTLVELEAKLGKLPSTVIALTGGGGSHLLFRVPDGVHLRGTLGRGIDVKAAGGYIVASPSVHPNGRPYVWDSGAHPSNTAIAELPPAWVEHASEQSHGARTYGPAVDHVRRSFIGLAFQDAGCLGRELPEGKVAVRCPWLHEHSPDAHGRVRGDGDDSSTVILPPSTEARLGAFHCSHAHCEGRRTEDAIRALPRSAIAHASRTYPDAMANLLKRLAKQTPARRAEQDG